MENVFDDVRFEYNGESYFVSFVASYREYEHHYNHNIAVGDDMGPDEYELELENVYDIDVSREGKDGFYDIWEDWKSDKDFADRLRSFCINTANDWGGE